MSFLQCEHLISDKPRVLTAVKMREKFTSEDCEAAVRNRLGNDRFELLNYELEDLPEHGEVRNEKTRILRVKIKEPGRSSWTLLKFFLKELPDPSGDSTGLLTNEGHIYENVLQEIRKYIKGGKVFPDCYFARKNELVVLEDLSLSGYKSLNDYVTYDEDHIKVTLEAIAKYHAASIVLERKRNTTVGSLMPDAGKEVMFIQDLGNPVFEFLCSSITAMESVMDAYYSHYPEDIIKRAASLMKSIPERLKIIDRNAKFHVFSHADLWNNNIMFKYGEEGIVTSAVVFDFQLCKYSSPTFDVLQAIYLNSMGREEELEDLLMHYYNILSRSLATEDVSVHSLTTWDEFRDSIESMRPVMLAIAPICLHFMLMPKEMVRACSTSERAREFLLQHDRSDTVLEAMRINQNYRKRISHSVQNLLDYLKKQPINH